MSKLYIPKRTPEQRRKDADMMREKQYCDCVHYDWLTCIAKREHTTPFNAMILFAKGGNSDGKCTCGCHKDEHDCQVPEEVWNRRVRRQAVVA